MAINKLPPNPNVDSSVSKSLWDWLIKMGATVNQLVAWVNAPAPTTVPVHAATHAAAGSDPVSPASIGAAAISHKAAHAIGGGDILTPADIGAAAIPIQTTDITDGAVTKAKLATTASSPDYDSGWQALSIATTLTLTHRLGYTPLRAHLWGSNKANGIPTADSDYLIPLAPSIYSSGAYVTNLVFLTLSTAKVRGGDSGLWAFKTADGIYVSPTSGYVRLLLYR